MTPLPPLNAHYPIATIYHGYQIHSIEELDTLNMRAPSSRRVVRELFTLDITIPILRARILVHVVYAFICIILRIDTKNPREKALALRM